MKRPPSFARDLRDDQKKHGGTLVRLQIDNGRCNVEMVGLFDDDESILKEVRRCEYVLMHGKLPEEDPK